ncbi:MAG: hypothetical protein QNJ89_10010 [Acidimicrobiia bacterium]|nr:hypothetical protein [Acidimicrobiia bacterium]
MLDSRDPEIRALMVELGMSAEDAPGWEEIEGRAAQAGQAAPPVVRRSVPGWAVAVATAVVALVAIGGTLLLVGPRADVAETPTTLVTTTAPPVTTTAAPVTTTAAPVTTAAVEALVEEYYAAYNDGDAERAIGLLSPTMRMTSPAEIRFRVGELGERVEAQCIPAPRYPGAIVCAESYTDPLHAAAGLVLQPSFLYVERNGVLLQSADPGSVSSAPGCLSNRCPQRYDEFAAALFDWLTFAYPSAAARIGEASRLNYFAADGMAVAAALPFAAEFVAQSPDWGGSTTLAIAGMEPLEAVEAHYATLNSRDPAVFRSFYGERPDQGMLWFWELGTRWVAECETVPGDDTLVRCEEEALDDFYSKAGAVFRYGTLWSVSQGQMFSTGEWEMASDWVWTDFEYDFGDWMRSAYPDEHQVVFAGGARLARTPEAAAAAVKRIDEFIDQSPDYPRSPDPENEISRSTG